MSDLSKKIKPILEDLEKNLESEKDKQYCLEAFSKVFGIIEDEIDTRMEEFELRQKEIEFKTERMDEIINKMQDEFYIDDEEDFVELVCPYCNQVFETELSELKSEITCPECNNTIELNWNYDLDDEHDDHCSGSCSHCHGCGEEEEFDDFDYEENDDEDM